VYGILRAPRAASTEALVLSVPYRPPLSVHASTAPSIAIMLAFAKFANKEKYWAKDIIFLITEHEQLGMQAWLEAYHGVGCGNDGTLDHGDIKGRAGAIQAAINLEFHESLISQVDIKVEGLNGQLPNLDLFNLAAKMLHKEGIPHTFKNRPNKSLRDPVKDWLYSLQTLLAMISTQATGIPNGNHGLYHRFGIEALTLESSSLKGGSKAAFLSMGRIIEGIFRSLNNLLERFHQSYFFYLLPSSERFISIGNDV
jgi:glycosylphosphatidylinositol transamidase